MTLMLTINGYGLVNIKVKHDVTNEFELITGIDNVLDKSFTTTIPVKTLCY